MRSLLLLLLLAAVLLFSGFDMGMFSRSTEVVERKALPMDVSFEAVEARTLLNSIRESMHLTALSQNRQLKEAAQAHAAYMVQNRSSSHYETEGKPGFTGHAPLDRAFHAGYNASQVSENLSANNDNAQSSIDGLFAAIYHRFGFLSPDIDEVGVGVAQQSGESQNSAFVYLMGNSEFNRVCSYDLFRGSGSYVYGVCRDKSHKIGKKRFEEVRAYNRKNNPKIIFYPYDGQREVPLAFYHESPDPLPDYDVSGFPVSVAFNDFYVKSVRLISFSLSDAEGTTVKTRFMDRSSDPHGRFSDKQFALFPLERLKYDTRYRVYLKYRDASGIQEKRWTFHTRKPTEVLHTIVGKEEGIRIDPTKSHLIYFKPRDPHDLVKNVQFPQELDAQFIDNNTLKITVMDPSLGDFDIVTATRTVHVVVDSH